MKRWSIRVRLTVLYGGLFFLAGALLLGVTYLLMEQSLQQRIQPDRGGFVKLRGQLGEAEPPQTVLLDDGREVNIAEAMEFFRAEEERFADETLNSLLTQGGIALAGVGLLAGMSGWLLAGRVLRPVHQITETARRIASADSARGLHERIALTGPRDELKKLADTFDSMLERLDGSFDGQRRFVASASHEMRTPLAINRALIEVTTTRPHASADAQELGRTLLEINARHERLIDGLLTLADSENEVTERTPLDLAEVTEHALATMDDAASTARVEIRPGPLYAAPVTGDPVLLERLVQNLIENAIRHNLAEGGWLSARTRLSADGAALLEVENTGPVIPSYEAQTLLQPFRRRTGDRTGGERGAGLGLSIVQAVATAHGGQVQLTPRPGGGLIVTVLL